MMWAFAKGFMGFVVLMLMAPTLPEVVSSDAVFIGIAIIIGGAVAYSGKD